MISASNKNEVAIWDVSASPPRNLSYFFHDGDIRCLIPSSNWLFSGVLNGTIRKWNISDLEKPEFKWDSTSSFYTYYGNSFDVSEDGRYVFGVSRKKGKYIIVEDTLKQKSHELRAHSDLVMGLAYSRKFRRLYSVSYDKCLVVWDARQLEELFRRKSIHKDHIYCLVLSKKEKFLFTGSRDQTVKVFQADTGCLLSSLNFKNQVFTLSLSFSDTFILFGGLNNAYFKIWKTKYLCFKDISLNKTGKQIRREPPLDDRVNKLLGDSIRNDQFSEQTISSDSLLQQLVIRESDFNKSSSMNQESLVLSSLNKSGSFKDPDWNVSKIQNSAEVFVPDHGSFSKAAKSKVPGKGKPLNVRSKDRERQVLITKKDLKPIFEFILDEKKKIREENESIISSKHRDLEKHLSKIEQRLEVVENKMDRIDSLLEDVYKDHKLDGSKCDELVQMGLRTYVNVKKQRKQWTASVRHEVNQIASLIQSSSLMTENGDSELKTVKNSLRNKTGKDSYQD